MAQGRVRGWALGWVLSALLAGCGGGGGGSSAASAPENPTTSNAGTTPPATQASYAVGGVVSGLAGEVTLRDASGQELTLRGNGTFRLATPLPQGTPYAISVARHPVGQTCTASNNVGRVDGEVADIRVDCATTTYPIAVNVQGLVADAVVTSSLGDAVTVHANGSVTLTRPVPYGQSYTLAVQSPGQACAFDTASGTAQGQALAATLTCSVQTWTLGGAIQGLAAGGSLTLRNGNNGEAVFGGNVTFTWPQPMPNGSTYAITVAAQPASQQCTVTNGSGTITGNVANLLVSCADAPPPPVQATVPGTPSNFGVSYGAKSYTFHWDAVPGATRYELWQDVDGSGPTPIAPVAQDIAGTTYTMPLDVILHQRIVAMYGVRACNAAGCGVGTNAITPDVTRAIGYFKASNTGAGDLFGYSVALSSDGQTMAVGALNEDSYANGVNGDQANDGALDSGAVYIFVRTATGWSQQAYVKATTTRAGDRFGSALAFTPDGNKLAVGAPGSDGSKGRVYIYERSGTAWAGTNAPAPANGEAGDQFGWSVAFSADGTTLVVGAPGEASNATSINGNPLDNSVRGAGAVYVFTHPAPTVWQQQAYIKSAYAESSRFGTAIALTPDGDLLAVGAPYEAGMGSAYLFARSGGAWSRVTIARAGDPAIGSQYGSALALSGDGTTLAVGAPRDNHAATGINGLGSGTATDSGAVYLLRRFATGWAQAAVLKGYYDIAGDLFGTSVSFSSDGNMLAVGAPGESSSAIGFGGTQYQDVTQAGAVYLYGRSASGFDLVVYVKPSNTRPNTLNSYAFGQSLAISGDGSAMAVGGPGESGSSTGIQGNQSARGASSAGAVYLY